MRTFIFSLFTCLGFAGVAHSSQRFELLYPDGRIKLAVNPEHLSNGEGVGLARDFLSQWKEKLGYHPETTELKLMEVRHSIAGQHFHFQQYVDDVEVSRSEIVVSLNREGNQVYKVYSSLKPDHRVARPLEGTLSKEQAFDIAWKRLQVTKGLAFQPKARLKHAITKDSANLVYEVRLSVLDPLGSFEILIDAHTGEVLSLENAQISRRKRDPSLENRGEIPTERILDRQAAFRQFYFSQLERESAEDEVVRKDGQALVFDPDPRTQLGREDLSDGSSAEEFAQAYQKRVLKGLRFDGQQYHLDGPWVRIIDWNSPNTLPSTSFNGVWEQKRGDNAFNDVMTYYHIDNSQRYIQSLGFVGEKGIIDRPIEIDTDGFDGADNSFYDTISKRLAFGHGCVDDNEDADVILHEYGHAIQHHIVRHWRGGHAGAMGEGFGDYWAASYRSQNQLPQFELHKIFSWDASSGCWGGRRIDQMEARYDDDHSYRAHGRGDGFVHDELWSTPLFSALKELVGMGVARSQVDRIILEAHFGLSAGVTMREMAMATIATARLLSDGPEADVFARHFAHHNIIAAEELRMLDAE